MAVWVNRYLALLTINLVPMLYTGYTESQANVDRHSFSGLQVLQLFCNQSLTGVMT